LIDMGVNDCAGAIDAAWSNNFCYCLDAVHTKWPSTKVYVTLPWQTNSCPTYSDMTNTITRIVANRNGWCFPGVDEVNIITGDNTDDGTHLSHWGCVSNAVAWKAVLGL
jgi:hypothetical protein